MLKVTLDWLASIWGFLPYLFLDGCIWVIVTTLALSYLKLDDWLEDKRRL